MTIGPGTRLGPYQVISRVGGGGMGEVYRARDTRLQRDVAIKVLAANIVQRREAHERFEHEARAVASLNHPHICTLHDIGDHDGTSYLVMEYLEGDTLAQRLRSGPLPIAQVLQYGIEIADALDKAHRKGITHRDLKPGNIILTKTGAKLLDFGLAKLQRSATEQLAEGPTQDGPITAEGTILGTLQYMAPERLEGKEADARSDLFALGAVLYEMTTGLKAFEGKSHASVIAAIMSAEPPKLSTPQPMTPPALDRLIRKCLRKDPDDRWQSARDVCDELQWLAESGTPVSGFVSAAPAAPPLTRARSRRYVWAAAVVLLGVAVIGAMRLIRPGRAVASASPPPVHFTIDPPEKGYFPAVGTNFGFLNISPDGTKVVFNATDAGGRVQLWIRSLDSPSASLLPGTENAFNPFWSPDSRSIAFSADGKLKRMDVSGSPPQTIADVPAGRGAWSSGGVLLLPAAPGMGLLRLPASGGTPRPATVLDKARNEVAHQSPSFLPDGEHFVFSARSSTPDNNAIYLGSLNSSERKRVLSAHSDVIFVQPGYLLFRRDRTAMAQLFDPEQGVTVGDAVPIAEGVQFNTASGASSLAASQNGVLAYRTSVGTPPRKLVWVSRNGSEEELSVPPRVFQQPRLSPDGRRIALEIDDQSNQVWVYDFERQTLTRLTFEGSDNELPIWTPDGRRVVFYSNQKGPLNLFWQMADGSGGLERLTTSDGSAHAAMSWSPDGRTLAFTNAGPNIRDIWTLNISDRKTQPFLTTPFVEGGAQFSPDGRWLAYVSNESGRGEVYVQPYPGPGGKWQISTDGGLEPMWNRNGRELFYRSGDRMMAVAVSTQNGFAPGRPQLLFERHYASTILPQTGVFYDVSPDGQRFLMVKEPEQASTPISIVLNWPALLGQRNAPGTN
jgi:eukaryotic-like serine/threonine-protein kinase